MLLVGNIHKNAVGDGTHADQSASRATMNTHAESCMWELPAEGIWKLNSNASSYPIQAIPWLELLSEKNQGVVALACGQRWKACKEPEEAEISVVALAHGLSVLSQEPE